MPFNASGCTPVAVSALAARQEVWLQAVTLSYIAYGIVLTLFFMCLYMTTQEILSNSTANSSFRQSSVSFRAIALLLYILAMTTLATLAIVSTMKTSYTVLVATGCWDGVTTARTPIFLDGMGNFSYVIANWGADGILVWRCWVIYGCSRRAPVWVSLLVPIALYLSVIGMGVFLMVPPPFSRPGSLQQYYQLIYSSLTLSLNIVATSMIVIRLLIYRFRVASILGESHGLQYTSIMAMVIESAALIVVFNVFFLVATYLKSPLRLIAFQGAVQVQTIAPLLIIFRVLQGKVWSPDNMKTLTGLQTTTGNPFSFPHQPADCQTQTNLSMLRFNSAAAASDILDEDGNYLPLNKMSNPRVGEKKGTSVAHLSYHPSE